MLKYIIAAIFLGSTLPGFSHSDLDMFEGKELNDENPAYLYVGLGSERLLSGDYISALEHFANAAALTKNADVPAPDIDFFIYFGQAIAYDNLDMQHQCRHSLGSMVLTLYALEVDDDDDDSDLLYDEGIIEEDGSPWTFMRELASLAPSRDVRMLLLDMIDHLAE